MSDGTSEPAESHERPEPRYPTNHVLAVIDTEAPLARAVESLTSGGFLDSEVDVSCGAEQANRLEATPGRGGLAGLVIRVAQGLGLEDDEMALKAHYVRALRDGGYVVRVAVPTQERKERAAEVLAEHGAHSINFFGRFTVEGMDHA